ncbi:acyl-CoA dehydrogenase family member 10, partial [Aphelenchoides avenae]
MAQQYKAVIFDLGGVAHEYTKPEYMQTLQAFLYEPGKEQLANDWRGWEMGTVTAEALIRRNIEITGPELQMYTADDALKGFECTEDPAVYKAIEMLRANGMKTAVLSNNGYIWEGNMEFRYPYVREPERYFDVMIESCRVGLRKPDPKIFQLAAERLNLKPAECVFLDDLLKNCRSAESVGMTTIQ